MQTPTKVRHIAVREYDSHFECYCGHTIPKRTYRNGKKTFKAGDQVVGLEWCDTCLYMRNLENEMENHLATSLSKTLGNRPTHPGTTQPVTGDSTTALFSQVNQ